MNTVLTGFNGASLMSRPDTVGRIVRRMNPPSGELLVHGHVRNSMAHVHIHWLHIVEWEQVLNCQPVCLDSVFTKVHVGSQ